MATDWFSIWVPEWRYIEFSDRNAGGSSQFDCKSVMLYDKIPYKGTIANNHCLTNSNFQTFFPNDTMGTLYNIEISPTDATTINGLYQ